MQLPITVDSPEVFASEKETYYFDRKSARKDAAEIAKHIAAFANAAGGKLVIGFQAGFHSGLRAFSGCFLSRDTYH